MGVRIAFNERHCQYMVLRSLPTILSLSPGLTYDVRRNTIRDASSHPKSPCTKPVSPTLLIVFGIYEAAIPMPICLGSDTTPVTNAILFFKIIVYNERLSPFSDACRDSYRCLPSAYERSHRKFHEVLLSPSKYVFMIRHTNAEYALSPAAPPDLATVKEMPDPIVLNHASMNAKIFRFCRNDASQISIAALCTICCPGLIDTEPSTVQR